MAGDSKKPYGDVTYADPGYQADGQKRYPLDTKDRVKSALSYINVSKNASKYSSADLAKVKAKIHAAAKKFGIGVSDSGQNSWSGDKEKEGAMSLVERRYTPGVLTLRGDADEVGKRKAIGGYAAVFNKLSRNLGGFVEELNSGVFNRAANDGWHDAICRYNHDDMALLGTVQSGHLRLQLDQTGLIYEVDPPNSRGDVLELVERGDITKSSFAFRTVEDDWAQTDQGYPKRTLLSVELVDVSPVVSPAYTDSSVGLRSLASFKDAEYDEVKILAEQDELRKLFVRTDGPPAPPPKKILTGASALAAIIARDRDPYDKD